MRLMRDVCEVLLEKGEQLERIKDSLRYQRFRETPF